MASHLQRCFFGRAKQPLLRIAANGEQLVSSCTSLPCSSRAPPVSSLTCHDLSSFPDSLLLLCFFLHPLDFLLLLTFNKTKVSFRPLCSVWGTRPDIKYNMTGVLQPEKQTKQQYLTKIPLIPSLSRPLLQAFLLSPVELQRRKKKILQKIQQFITGTLAQ